MVSEVNTIPIPDSSCLTRFRRGIGIMRMCARYCGADVTDPNFQWNWITYTLWIMIVKFYCCSVYTIHVKIKSDGNYTAALQLTCFGFIVIHSTVKFVCALTQRFHLTEAQSILDRTYSEYEKKGVKYQSVLNEGIALTMKGMKLFGFTYILAVITCSGFPIGYNLINNEKMLIMQYLLPGLDPATNTGYWLLTGIHISILGFGAFGNFAVDMYLFTFMGSMPLLKNILRCKFEDLNEMMSQELQPTRQQVQESIIDIVLWHKEYLRFLCCAEKTFYIMIFAHVFCSAASIVSTSYCMLEGIFLAAPVFLALSIANLYLYCGLGTLVDISNDNCTELIYTDSCWYNLPLSEQRTVLLMLRMSQATKSISVGNMMPLTVGTALQLTKAIYSMLMLLMSGREK